MSYFANYIEGFVSGVIWGWLSVVILCLYIAQFHHKYVEIIQHYNKENEESMSDEKKQRDQGDLTDEERKLIEEAVGYLNGLDQTFNVISQNPETFGHRDVSKKAEVSAPKGRYSGGEIDDMEIDFTVALKELKDKIRNCKAVLSFSVELGKVYAALSKNISKLAIEANNNTIQGSINLAQSSLFGAAEVENDKLSDGFWKSMVRGLELAASEYDALADTLSTTVSEKLAAAAESFVLADKRLTNEGNQRLIYVRDAMSHRDKMLKDRDRRKEKLSAIADKNSSIMSGLGTNKDLQEKLTSSEQQLHDADRRMTEAVKDLSVSLPKIIHDCLIFSARSVASLKNNMTTIAASMKAIHGRSAAIMEDVIRNIDTVTMDNIRQSEISASQTISPGSSQIKRLEYLRHLTLGLVSKVLESESIKNANSTSTNPNTRKLDMSLESTCSLAAAPPLKFLERLPQSFSKSFDQETSVWFNAFSGRIYRDIARSDHFHAWFCSKLGYLLNKGGRPGFVDEFKVDHVVFGATPPTLRNILWTPLFEDKRKSKRKPSLVDPDKAKLEANLLGPLDDPDNDVACLADLSFKSSVQFTMSTKLWCNWPRDHYASIPIVMKLEILEVSGRIKFGVRKQCSFVSFLEEPQTRFKINVEVGKQIIFKDIPLVSDFVEAKMRKIIRKRFVHPNAHKARLLWPRSWWPAGTENEFIPESGSEPVPLSKPVDSPARSSSDSLPIPSTNPTPIGSVDASSSKQKDSKISFKWSYPRKSAKKEKKDESVGTQFGREDPTGSSHSADRRPEGEGDFAPEDIGPVSIDNDSAVYNDNDILAEQELAGIDTIYADISANDLEDGSALIGDSSGPQNNRSPSSDSADDGSNGVRGDTLSLLNESIDRSILPDEDKVAMQAIPDSPTTQALATTKSRIAASHNSQNPPIRTIAPTNPSTAQGPVAGSSSAWLTSMAQKSKAKLLQFKDKHLKGSIDDIIFPNTEPHNGVVKEDSVRPENFANKRVVPLKGNAMDGPSEENSGSPAPVKRLLARALSARDVDHSTATITAVPPTSSPSAKHSKLPSISRGLLMAKMAIKNEVNNIVDGNRKASLHDGATCGPQDQPDQGL